MTVISKKKLDNREDVVVGLGRVPFARNDGSYLTPGWVLPGGLRTSSEQTAREYAERIDRYIRTGAWE